MRLVTPENSVEGAGLCFLCEGFMSREKVQIVDTNREFDPQFQHPLAGRKYVCGECATSLGYTIGMVEGKDVEAAKRAVDETRSQLIGLQNTIASLSQGIEDTVSDVLNLPALDVPVAVTDKEKK